MTPLVLSGAAGHASLVIPAALPRAAVALPSDGGGECVYVPPAPEDALAGLVDALASDLANCAYVAHTPFALERKTPGQVERDARRTPTQAPGRRVLGLSVPPTSVVGGGW
jgi:hypothetical protein